MNDFSFCIIINDFIYYVYTVRRYRVKFDGDTRDYRILAIVQRVFFVTQIKNIRHIVKPYITGPDQNI